jgi:hypothetical protein
MEFDKVVEIVASCLPLVVPIIMAKTVNNNSVHWTKWTGRFGKVVGLLVALADIFRSPASYKKDVLTKETR